MAVVIPPEQFTDMYKGKRAWILACGPSLLDITDQQWAEIDKEVTIGVNLVAEVHDAKILIWMDKDNPPEWMKASKAKYKLTKPNGTYNNDTIDVKNLKKNLTLNVADGLFCSGSTTQSALHLAIIMGCDPIILLGVDYGPYVHCYTWEQDTPDLRYPGAAKTIERFGLVKDLADKHGRTVLNGNMASEMEMFEKRTIDDILSCPVNSGGAGQAT